AVSAGSNPAGGAGQRHKFEHFDNLARAGARAPTCGDAQAFRTVCPIRTRKAGTGDERACSAAFGDDGRQAVALTAGRCPDRRPLPFPVSAATQRDDGTARAQLSSPPHRLDATWPMSRSLTSTPHSSRVRAAYLHTLLVMRVAPARLQIGAF